jgi:peptidoglycan/LPS O-acetylase OafA/YrhL
MTKELERRLRLNLDFVTGIRGLAASYVLVSHVWYQVWPAVLPPFGYGRRPEGLIAWVTGWFYFGHFGVVVFIVISGFCLMLPVAASNDRQMGGIAAYLRRRAQRIVPPYYWAIAFSLAAIYFWIGHPTGSQWDIALPATTFAILAHFLFLNDLVESTRINYVFWSIAIEAQLYLIFPFLVIAIRRTGLFATVLASLLFVSGSIVTLEFLGIRNIPPQFIGLAGYFVLGVAAAKMLISFPHHWIMRLDGLLGGAVAEVAIVAGLSALWGFDLAERRFAILDTLIATATILLLLAAARPGRNRVRACLEQRALLVVGTFSYSLYLIHAPILQIVWQYLIDPLRLLPEGQFVLLLLTGVPSCLMVAFLFFLACERPFMSTSDRAVFRFVDIRSWWGPILRSSRRSNQKTREIETRVVGRPES